MEKRKVNIGFLGYGYWGKNILRNLLNIENIEVKYVCDKNQKNLDKALKAHGAGPKYTRAYSDIINDPRVDAVVIATPPDSHFSLGVQALDNKKSVFIEKPMTTNVADAEALVKAAEYYNKVLMTGHTFVYCPAITDLKNLIDSGELGEIYYIDYIMTNLGKYQKHNILWDLGPHGISLVQYLLNSPKITKININGLDAVKPGLLDVAYLTMYHEKSFANIHFSWLNPNKERRLTVVGSKKMVVFDDINPLEKLRLYDKGVSKDKTFDSWGESLVGYRHGSITIPNTKAGEPLKIEFEHFVDCILNKKTPITDGKNGLVIVDTIEKANKLYKSGK